MEIQTRNTRHQPCPRRRQSSRKRYQEKVVDGKRSWVHRITAEREILYRPLAAGEVVHHIDGETSNNNPENLLVMQHAEHSRMHHIGRRLSPEVRERISIANTKFWFCESDIHFISTLHDVFNMSYEKIGEFYHCSRKTVSRAVKRFDGF
jgi:hypothetical protein